MNSYYHDYTRKYGAEDRRRHRGESIVASIGLLFFVPMITSPNSRYCHFWVRQGMVLLLTQIALLAAGLLFGWLFSLLAAIPVLGILFAILRVLFIITISLCGAFLTFLSIYYAVRGWARELPVFGVMRIFGKNR